MKQSKIIGLALTFIISMKCLPLVLADDELNGTWKVIAGQSNGITSLNKDDSEQWTFAGTKVTYRHHHPIGTFPLSGTVFDCSIDASKEPHRIDLSFTEGGGTKTVFAYGIFDLHHDILMVRFVYPLALANPGVPRELRESYLKNPYPKTFENQQGDCSAIGIMQRVESRGTINPPKKNADSTSNGKK